MNARAAVPAMGAAVRSAPLRGLAVGLATLGVLAACGGPGRGARARLETLDPAALRVAPQGADPSLAVDPATGELYLAWVAETDRVWNLWFARSSDGGETFGDPIRVNDVAGDVHPHAEGAPRLVAAPGVLALFWNNQYLVENRAFGAADLRFSRSVDGGRSWSPAVDLQDDPGGVIPGSSTFHGAAWAGDSTLVVAWLDGRDRDARRIERAVARGIPREEAMRNPEAYEDPADVHDGDASVYAAFSHDLGATWEPTNRRIQEGLCPCCRITLARGPEGEVYGVWRQNYAESLRDPAFADLGAGENRSIRIHEDAWAYPGCPHSGPALSVDPAGRAHAAWYTGAPGRMGVHYAWKAAGAERFSEPVPLVVGEAIPIAHPAIVARPDGGAVAALNVNEEGRRVIVFVGISPEAEVSYRIEVPDSEGGTHPQLALLPDGHVVAAWTESRGGISRVRMARLETEGSR